MVASVAELVDTGGKASTQSIVTLDRLEKQRWKTAADRAGLSMAEYVRRAVGQSADAPTAQEIVEARALATQVQASVDRMEAMLDRTNARITEVVDPAVEDARRSEIFADIGKQALYLDLDHLARSS